MGAAIGALLLTTRYKSWAIGISASFALFFFLVLPTIRSGYFRGYDSWKYIGSAKRITLNGWLPNSAVNIAHTNQFPGIQLLTVLTSEILGITIVQSAKLLPVLMTLSVLLLLIALGQIVGLQSWLATLPAIALSTYFNFVAFSTYHHFLAGFFGVFYLLPIILAWQRTTKNRERWLVLLLLGIIMVTISHQFSGVLAGVLVLLATVLSFIQKETRFAEMPKSTTLQWNVIIPVLIFSLLGIVYYLWMTDEFIIALSIMLEKRVVPSPPSPMLMENLIPLFGQSLLNRLVMSYHIMSVLVLVTAIGIILIANKIWKKSWDNICELTIFFWIVSLFLLTVLVKIVPLVDSMRRMMKFTVPLLLVGLILSWSVSNGRSFVKYTVYVSLSLFIVLSLFMYPAYMIGYDSTQYEQRYHLTIDADHRQAFEWAANHNNELIGGTMSRQYLEGLNRNINVEESQKSYISCPPNSHSLVLLRKGYQRMLFMRSKPYQFALPKHYYDQFNSRQCLDKVYSNDRNDIYWSINSST